MADQAGTQHGHWGPYATHRHMQQPHFTTQSEFGSYWPNIPGVSQNQNPHLSTLAYKMEEMQQTLDKLTENFTTENDKVLLQGRLEETEKQLTEKKQEVVSLQETLKERSNEAILSAMDYILRVLKKNNDNMKKKKNRELPKHLYCLQASCKQRRFCSSYYLLSQIKRILRQNPTTYRRPSR